MQGGKSFCCPACHAAWLPRPTGLHLPPPGVVSGMSCPQCKEPALVAAGRTDRGDLWRCLSCGGVLVGLAPAHVPLPERASRSATVAAAAVEILGQLAAGLGEIAAG